MAREKICGIYKITNQVNGKVYIGQSEDIFKRWQEHKRTATRNDSKEGFYPLYQAIRENGIENFTFEILEECFFKDLNYKEEHYISLYESFPPSKGKGYNQTPGGCSKTPYIHGKTEEYLLDIIKDLKVPSLKYEDIALKYNLSADTIRNINKGTYVRVKEETYPIRKVNSSFCKEEIPVQNEYFCSACGSKISNNSKTGLCRKCFEAQAKIKIPSKEQLLKDLYEMRVDQKVAEKYNISTMLLKKWKEELNIPRKRPLVDKMYEEEYLHLERKPKRDTSPKIVLKIDPTTNEIVEEFPSTAAAGRSVNSNNWDIIQQCEKFPKIYKNFYWKFK